MSLAISPSKVVTVLTATTAEVERLIHVESEGIAIWAEASDADYFLKIDHRPSSLFSWEEVYFKKIDKKTQDTVYIFPQVRIVVTPVGSGSQPIYVAIKQASSGEVENGREEEPTNLGDILSNNVSGKDELMCELKMITHQLRTLNIIFRMMVGVEDEYDEDDDSLT